jgi:ABC-type cobalamin/Fe3+-siderophores transport system ATPase subunit
MISVHALSYSLSDRDLLSDISLTFNDGDICALIGPSGSGKSILLGVLSGNAHRKKGCTTSSSADLKPFSTTLFPGSIEINQSDSVENIILAARTPFKKLTAPLSSLDRQIAEFYIRTFNLEAHLKTSLELLSDSIYKKTWLAHAFARESEILMLDNPCEGLDPSSVIELERSIVHYAAEGHIVIFATHDINFAARVSDRIIVMKNGKVFSEGSADIITDDFFRRCFGIEVMVTSNVYNGRPEISVVPQS